MIHRQTQTAAFWKTYQVQTEDAEFIFSQLLEEGKPRRTIDLAQSLLHHKVEHENAALRAQLNSKGAVYLPRNRYAPGDQLNFPLLGFLGGVVTATRPGNNPEVGEPGAFEVISVDLNDGTKREFAGGYPLPHKLNDLDVSTLVNAEDLKTPEQLFELHGEAVCAAVESALEKNGEVLRIGQEWYLRAMMAEVNVGHLNLAEAVLDIAAGKPLTAAVILHDLGLPEDVTATVQEASLNSALAADKRFDDVSLNETPAWILHKSEPAEVRERPAQLEPAVFAGVVTLGDSLETLAERIDDELDFPLPETFTPAESATCVLTFAHRGAGTLGLTRGLAAVVLLTGKPRVPVTFKDRASGREFIVWLVRAGRYVWGLAEFYRSAELPAGAEITISRTAQHDVFQIDARKRKPKREWVRVASRVNDGRLRLETAQRGVTCEFDDLMSVFVDDARPINAMHDVAGAVRDVFPEIAKLSPQGNVHARTLYAVVNVLTRASARNVFAALVAGGGFEAVGDDYWHLGER